MMENAIILKQTITILVVGNLGAPSGSETDKSHSQELIRQGKVGFVSIPEGINVAGTRDVIGIMPDKSYAIVDCSSGNYTLPNVRDSFGYAKYGENYRDYFQRGGAARNPQVSIPHTVGPKNAMDRADLDMRQADKRESHQQLLKACQEQIDQVELF